jgi:flagellin
MVSINTNSSAISALQTLRNINQSMAGTQAQISSGLRVQTASDNAAYWSIATTVRSDNKAVSAVKDALELGSAKLDVAYTGLDSTIEVLDEIKAKLVAASEPGVDKAKVQKEIKELQNQLTSISESASFNGVNWLKVDTADLSTLSASIVGGFTRGNNGSVSVQALDVDLAKTVLFNTQGGGLLQTAAGAAGSAGAISAMNGLASLDALGSLTDVQWDFTSSPFTFEVGMSISFDIVEHNSPDATFNVTIDRSQVDTHLGPGANGTISSLSDWVTVLAFTVQGTGSSVVTNGFGGSPDRVRFYTAGNPFEVQNVTSSGFGSSGTNPSIGIMDINITSASGADLDNYIDQVELMLQSVTDAAAGLGATSKRVTMQTEFTQTLMETVTKGIGRLVDADMNEASTRLKALQTQEQLGVQALSIANSNSETILQLFR